MVVSKGWLPKDPLTLREMSRETVKRLDQIPVTERRASVFNDLGRELTLEFAGEMLRQTLRAEEDPIKPEPMVIEGAFAVLADGIRRFPESLPLRFNAVRAALHFGLDKEVKWALALARDTLGIPYREWDVDPLEDVFPWDFFSPFFNYRAYFDRVTQSLGGGPGPNPDLARLIFASIHHYLSHFLNPLDHAPQAAALDPGFPFYTYKWVLALLERGQSQDVAQAIRLLTGLADGSILAPEALVLLQRIEEAGIPLGFDRNMVSWFGQRMNDGKAMAKAVNAYVSPSEWRVTRLARPTETSKV
jgi:hypothetical protein